jgi:hypothetical protein
MIRNTLRKKFHSSTSKRTQPAHISQNSIQFFSYKPRLLTFISSSIKTPTKIKIQNFKIIQTLTKFNIIKRKPIRTPFVSQKKNNIKIPTNHPRISTYFSLHRTQIIPKKLFIHSLISPIYKRLEPTQITRKGLNRTINTLLIFIQNNFIINRCDTS